MTPAHGDACRPASDAVTSRKRFSGVAVTWPHRITSHVIVWRHADSSDLNSMAPRLSAAYPARSKARRFIGLATMSWVVLV